MRRWIARRYGARIMRWLYADSNLRTFETVSTWKGPR